MISAACVVWIGWAIPNLGELYYGQPSSALWEDQLFVAINDSRRTIGFLYRGPLDTTRKGVRQPMEYWKPSFSTRRSFQAKLDIRGDRILLFQAGGAHVIVSMLDLQLLECTDFGERLCKLRGYVNQSTFANAFSGGTGERLLFPEHRDHDVPLPPEPGFGGGRIEDPECVYARTARLDVQLAGPKTVRLLHAHKDRLFVSIEWDYLNGWYYDGTGKVKKDLPKPPERELRTGKLPAEFTERFAAYTSAKRDYLVTDNGKVYMAVPKGKAEVEVSAVWTDPKQRIVGVVQDQANDAAYGWGFVTDSAAAERFYVKMEPKPVAVAYKRTAPLWGDRSDAYLESYECARAFRKAAEKK